MSETPFPPLPPRGERFSDPATRVVWAAVERLTEAQKHLICDELTAHLALPENRVGKEQQRVARAVGALRDAQEELWQLQDAEGEPRTPLSVKHYRELRVDHALDHWPDDVSIRRWFGSWNQALQAAHLDAAPDGDALVSEIGAEFTRRECIDAVRAYSDAESVAVPAMDPYLRWAKRAEVKRLPGRRPVSQHPFDRLFGGWTRFLIAAGFIETDDDGQIVVTDEVRRVLPRRGHAYTDEQIHEALREIATLLGASPKTTDYAAARQAILDREAAAGLAPRAFPSKSLLAKRYPNWDAALVAAGLEPVNGRYDKTGCGERASRRRTADEVVVDAIRAAYARLGHPFTAARYTNEWRPEALAAARAHREPIASVPTYNLIWNRFGSWDAACRAALGDNPPSPGDDSAGPGDDGEVNR